MDLQTEIIKSKVSKLGIEIIRVPEDRDLDTEISVFGPNLNTDLKTENRKYRTEIDIFIHYIK
jgi:hypothetical protein